MLKYYIITNIPKSIQCLEKVLEFLEDSSWDHFNKNEWCNSETDFVYYDKTRKEYNYTNYSHLNVEHFVDSGLEPLDFDIIIK